MDWRYFRRVARTSRGDFAVLIGTFLATLLVPLAYAVFVGIALNLALYLRKASHLHMHEMVDTPAGPFIERPVSDRHGSRRVMFLQLEGDLFFGLADELGDRLSALGRSGVRVVVLRLKRTHSIDSTVLSVLEDFVKQMRDRDAYVLLCGVRPELKERLDAFGITALIGDEHTFEVGYGVFSSAKRALQRARRPGAGVDGCGGGGAMGARAGIRHQTVESAIYAYANASEPSTKRLVRVANYQTLRSKTRSASA